jgi:hypothetical protein
MSISLQPNRRVMTSAIDNMSVAEVRKFLGECRKKYTSQTLNRPMYITDMLSNDMTIQDFALKFQQGHHQKRHNKGRKHLRTECNPEDDNSSGSDDEYMYNFENSSSSSSSNSNSGDAEEVYQKTSQTKQNNTTPKLIDNTCTNSGDGNSPVVGVGVGVGSSVNNSSSADVSTIHSTVTKKRGRPKKTKYERNDKNKERHRPEQQQQQQQHDERDVNNSRSLMDFVRSSSSQKQQLRKIKN